MWKILNELSNKQILLRHLQEDIHGAFQKLLEWYNKCIAAGGDYFEGKLDFHECTINKSAHTKKCLETYLMILVIPLQTKSVTMKQKKSPLLTFRFT